MTTFSDVNIYAGDEPYSLVYDVEAINKSIQTICLTRRGTRPFRRNFGSDCMVYVFDPIDDRTAYAIREEMLASIKEFEKRVIISDVTVLPDRVNEQFYVSITYSVPALAGTAYVINFNLTRG